MSSNAPSWAAVYSLIKKQKARVALGHHYENSNKYTDWYGFTGPFCFMFVSWILAHAGESEAAGLALIGGKKAYVPYIRQIKGYRAGHSGVKVGAIAAVNRFNHIGFVTKVNSNGTFELYSGNTTYGGSDDAVWPKTYSLSYISGYVNLAYGSSSASATGDDVPNYVSVGGTTEIVLKKNGWKYADWGHEYHDDHKQHGEGNVPSLLFEDGAYFAVQAGGVIKGLSDNAKAYAQFVEVKPKGDSFEVSKTYPIQQLVGDGGKDIPISPMAIGQLSKGARLRVRVMVPDSGCKLVPDTCKDLYWK